MFVPERSLSHGFHATPAANASEIRSEVREAFLSRSPDDVCLLRPSNNLISSRIIEETTADFLLLSTSLVNHWSKVSFS